MKAIHMPMSEKIGEDLKAYIENPPFVDPLAPATVVIRLKIKASELLAQMNDSGTLLLADRATSIQQALKTVTKQQTDMEALIKPHSRNGAPLSKVEFNNTITGTFGIDYIQNTLVAYPEVVGVELEQFVTAEEFFGTPKASVRRKSLFWRLLNPFGWLTDSKELMGVTKLKDEFGITGNGVLIGVIDSGMLVTHDNFRGRLWDDVGKNFGDGADNDFSDPINHGTQCAGIIAGRNTGVAPGAKMMVLKVFRRDSRGNWIIRAADCMQAMEFGARNGCHILSLSGSLVGKPSAETLAAWQDKVDSLATVGVLLVGASGEDGTDMIHHDIPYNMPLPGSMQPPWLHPDQLALTPGAHETRTIVAVSALQNNGDYYDASGKGPSTCQFYPHPPGLIKPDFCAPSASINTSQNSHPHTYRAMSVGTSAATACVSGCFALLLEKALSNVHNNVEQRAMMGLMFRALSEKSMPFADQTAGSKTCRYGAGIVNVYDAYTYGRENDKRWWP